MGSPRCHFSSSSKTSAPFGRLPRRRQAQGGEQVVGVSAGQWRGQGPGRDRAKGQKQAGQEAAANRSSRGLWHKGQRGERR